MSQRRLPPCAATLPAAAAAVQSEGRHADRRGGDGARRARAARVRPRRLPSAVLSELPRHRAARPRLPRAPAAGRAGTPGGQDRAPPLRRLRGGVADAARVSRPPPVAELGGGRADDRGHGGGVAAVTGPCGPGAAGCPRARGGAGGRADAPPPPSWCGCWRRRAQTRGRDSPARSVAMRRAPSW